MERRGKGKELFLLHQEHIQSLSSHSWNCVVLPNSDLLFRRNFAIYIPSAKALYVERNKNKDVIKNE